jgi:uncharacterized surface protein with fasciclin (FAS1) repeats
MKTNHLTQYSIVFAFAAVAPLALAQDTTVDVKPGEELKIAVPPDATDPAKAGVKVEVSQAYEKGTLTTVIQDSVTFSVLTKALKAAELDVTLGTKGSYTIFAPTDEAFSKLPKGTLDQLLLPENKEKLRSLLLYHVIPGVVAAADLKDGDVKTMNGEKVEVDVDGKKIEVNDSKVFSSDTVASNGVMHSIGNVLVPKSLDGFAKLDD